MPSCSKSLRPKVFARPSSDERSAVPGYRPAHDRDHRPERPLLRQIVEALVEREHLGLHGDRAGHENQYQQKDRHRPEHLASSLLR